MEENRINVSEILRNCPKGTKLWSPLFGEVTLLVVNPYPYCIEIITSKGMNQRFTEYSCYYNNYEDAECLLFPSKENRDWSTFKFKKPKFDPKTLQPFDRVLCRLSVHRKWTCGFFSYADDNNFKYAVNCLGNYTKNVIPYNDETKHLVGTKEEAPEFYRYWEE